MLGKRIGIISVLALLGLCVDVSALDVSCESKMKEGVPPSAVQGQRPPSENDSDPFTQAIVRWNAPGANFVLLPGLAEGPQEIRGQKEAWAPAIFTVIAITDGEAEVASVLCRQVVLPGPEPNEPLLPISFIFNERTTYSWSFPTKSTIDEVFRTLTVRLQGFGFPVKSSPAAQRVANEATYYTEFNSHKLLCDKDCTVSLEQRIVEREVMFILWVAPIKGSGNIQINLQPMVVSRNRREGGPWVLKENETNVAGELCRQIAEEVIRKLRTKG